MTPIETYLRNLFIIHSSGSAVKETSYYGTLENLLNEIGKTLTPRVRCIINIANRGAGLPDGGLFTPDQFQKRSKGHLITGQLPSRGCIEIKSTLEDLDAIVESEQVRRYVSRYRQVLITNYREFILVGLDVDENLIKKERFVLASNDADFWIAIANPSAVAEHLGERLIEYLKRVMLHAAPLTLPQDVAWFLASYARDAKARIENQELPALDAIRAGLEEALGMKFEGARGERFFRSTFVQTLFYGIFSSWVLWSKTNEPPKRGNRFNWREAAWSLHVPMIKALFEQVATHSKLEPLNLVEPLEWTGEVLNRVDRTTFFANFEEGEAVQYFYEPFLQAFDPQLRKELGVWYTPTEIVRYMVGRVNTILREQLEIVDGLADPRVYVLDPSCGTGAYLVEVLRKIHEILRAKGEDALAANDLKRASIDRVFGFEILPAPFVVSHLQLGLLLQRLGAPLNERKAERVGVFLTNALTGWEPPTEAVKRRLEQLAFAFAELKEEHDAAERIKRKVPILVILGNPPYNGFAGVAVEEERDLSNAYRTTIKAPAPQGQGLNDLYIRFFRMAERRIVDQSGRGIVCFISNYSWLDGLSFTGMRERYLNVFDEIWIDNLHGDRIISEYAPDGRTSETVFALNGTSPGIKIGTAISLLVKRGIDNGSRRVVYYRDLNQARAEERRRALVESVHASQLAAQYQELEPAIEIGLPLKPRAMSASYFNWPLLPELFPVSFAGVKTSRDSFLVDIDHEAVQHRMEKYFDPKISNEELRLFAPDALNNTARFNAFEVRNYLIARGFKKDNIVRYCYRPFDVRWLYWEPETKLLDEKRSEYRSQIFAGNLWLSCTTRSRKEAFYVPLVTPYLTDLNVIEANAQMFPMMFRGPRQLELHEDVISTHNLSEIGKAYVADLDANFEDCFYHAVAIMHSSSYRQDNSGALRQDWPRIPLPGTKEDLLRSAALGRTISRLLDTEARIDGITSGTIRGLFRSVGAISHITGKPLSIPEDLGITAGWGHAGKGGITMPGKGKIIERAYTADEILGMKRDLGELDISMDEPLSILGQSTCDVYLNGVAYWRNIPARVWGYTIGGYQVIKKWLSYREFELLRRSLTPEEARTITNIARRIAAIILLEPILNSNYEAIKKAT